MSSRRAPKTSDSRNYYEILQVPKNASQDDVRKAYRIAAMKHHPDKGGHPEMFIELTNAYEVLSDPVKRAIYDKSGEDRHGEDRSGEDRYSKDRSGEDRYSKDRSDEDRYSKDRCGEDRYSKDRCGEDRYSKDRCGEDRYSKDRCGEDRYSKDRCGEDRYSKDRCGEDRYSKDRCGEDRYCKDRYGQDRYCKDCYGEDRYGEDRYSKDCYRDDQHCDGCYSEDQHRDDWYYLDVIHYLSVSLEELYKGTFKEVSFKRDRLCDKCNGTGKSKDRRYRCQKCKGDKVVEKQKTLLIEVNKGMRNRQRIIVAGQGHQAPEDTIAGDFVCVLEQKEHPKFKRKGDDLIFECTISSAEAHYGFKFVLTHLDGWTEFSVKCGPKGGSVDQFEVTINDAGMPMYLRPSVKGKLYVNFTVDYPPDRYY